MGAAVPLARGLVVANVVLAGLQLLHWHRWRERSRQHQRQRDIETGDLLNAEIDRQKSDIEQLLGQGWRDEIRAYHKQVARTFDEN
jgi:hypothetical protein